MFVLTAYLEKHKQRVETELASVLPAATPAALREACMYSLLAGGKRLRPILTFAASEAVGGTADDALAPALALEMIHTYSLIHDDLPAMDNDDFRRGRPTNHKVFGDGMAVLAGDALLSEAFHLVAAVAATGGERGHRAAQCVAELARASGCAGMVGGQVLDLQATGKQPTEADLIAIHRLKTGALFVAAVVTGALLGGADETTVARLRRFAEHAGLGFQIIDDILDVTADLATLGKDPGSDRAKGKTTYVDVLGLDGARASARACLERALAEVTPLGAPATALAAIARHLIDRDR